MGFRRGGTQQDGHSGKDGFLEDSIPPWTTLKIWWTWSQFLELPFSNYIAALPGGALEPGGTGAGVGRSRCVSHKPKGPHNSSDTEIKVVLHWKKENQTVHVSMACPGLSPGHPETAPHEAIGISTDPSGHRWEHHPNPHPPGWKSS